MSKSQQNIAMEKEKRPENVEPCSIVEEMKGSYLDYAMSVIVSRALPDVRDGMKPVHRRIMYAMWDLGLKAGAKFRKSATVVGEVLGKYHPHGDQAVYDSMVRMAQDFSMRYQLVNGQGNFGSMDGDRAAAMRYTEAKLAAIAEEMIFDIEKETVPFSPNYDGSRKEPRVLPAKLPNLLLNGTMGIAVGMATNIPPHNLGELCDGIMHLIDNSDATVDDLMQHIKGPDFPTGGFIFDINAIKQAYATGKGGIVMRANSEIVERKKGHYQIVVTEIPYQVNKASLLEKIAGLVKDKKIEGIRDLRDESDKEGVRIVIELKKDTYPQKVLNRLYKLTQLQDTFYVNIIALVDGIQPKVLNLVGVLNEFIRHRREMVCKRTEYELKKAKDRTHILEGLKIALVNINAIIKAIKESKDKEEAKANLIKKFKLTEIQALAILDMKLQQLAGLERLKVEQELKDKLSLIKKLEAVLSSPKKIMDIIKRELEELKDKYCETGDSFGGGEYGRRTKVIPQSLGKFSVEDLVPDETCVITITQDGYIKRLPPEVFKTQTRGGKGVMGLTTKKEDIVQHLFTTTTHCDLLFFTTLGRVFQLKAYDVPKAGRTAKGQALVNFLQVSQEEKVSAVLPLRELGKSKYLVMATRQGMIKKVDMGDFENVRRSGLIAIKLRGEDRLQWVKPSGGKDEVVLVSARGQAIRFEEKDVRPMGRAASGVRGIRLKNGDQVVGMDIVKDSTPSQKKAIIVVTEQGFGKRTPLKGYKVQGRGGSGIKTAKITDKTGQIVASRIIDETAMPEWIKGDLIIISSKGQVIRLSLGGVSVLGRATQGVRLMRFKEKDDKVASIALV